jgi:hypothetical protein
MRSRKNRILGGALPTTVSAGAIALLTLSLWARSADATTGPDPKRVEHLETLLVQHDVRYAMQVSEQPSTHCRGVDAESGL